ncbi:MAG TPA: glycosyltransferase, partial [Chthonomonadales bacterium]|nr:glycosyltransferase [Chthonomonadales bacterium]
MAGRHDEQAKKKARDGVRVLRSVLHTLHDSLHAFMRYPRILFYAVNGLGLGHVTRLLAIARKLREALPEAEIIFFTSSEAEDVIFREGFAAFKVPSKTLRAEAHLRPSTYARMVQTVTLNLLASFHPHVMVVDTFPAGTIQELLPVLRWDSRKVFVFRVQRPEVANSPLTQNALQLYDLAIIPHNEGEEEIPLPEGLDRLWTGPILIRDRAETLLREEARAMLGLPVEGKALYVTFGGGGDAEMERTLTIALEGLGAISGVHIAVATPPLYRGWIRRYANITPVHYYPMAALYPAFDAAISAAGYNTAMELLHHGVPTAFVPFPRQVDDQEARARRIEEAGAGLCLRKLEAEALPGVVERLLDPVRASRLRENAQRLVPE